ncbi:hypothetical protein SGFS_100100 [Streptomyces graminofaciens]|uniref:Uncharacterized protein n=1 Tax=Streptomyces graminofaciens TaxID=68212 RepID=A0ABN5W4S7_9ACTN|nr:hypothetical protein SGFS_100100 [Streptomyces graminofaciens]
MFLSDLLCAPPRAPDVRQYALLMAKDGEQWRTASDTRGGPQGRADCAVPDPAAPVDSAVEPSW